MKAVVMRVRNAGVRVDDNLVNSIQNGLLVLLGVHTEDTEEDVDYIVKKVLNLRIFDDEDGVMNKSVQDINGSILSISQFTLQASVAKGNRPSYSSSMKANEAIFYYELFNKKLNEHIKTYPGVFGANMMVDITNDGPVTIIIDSKIKK